MIPLRFAPWRTILAFATLIACLSGCHRAYYREKADAAAYSLIDEKANHPHWQLPGYSIEVAPHSRMFNPFDPDQPPMPPDDPASHELMHYIDGRKGYPHWHANGDTPYVENPTWMEYLPLDQNGVLNLGAEQAYQLALLHSSDYQSEFETLYLSALDVSTERFRFDTQFFGGYSAFYTTSGRLRSPRSELELSTFTQETGRTGLPAGGVRAPSSADLLMRKSFATGADLAVGFANSLVWEFAGPNDHSAFTILDVSLIQPLLRRAGRDRMLEQLTIAERALLANVRQMERFRRGFYVEILTGIDAGPGATRRGGFFGAAGLGGFTGVGGGGFGRVGGGGGGGGGGGFGAAGAGAAQVGGFLGLLQDLQDIRNQQVTIVGLRSNLAQLRESLRESLTQIPEDVETIVRERLQIAQARQALLNAESRLLNSQAAFQTRLDGFKTDLGLPPEVCVNIEDAMIDQFNLIDPGVLEVQSSLTELRGAIAQLNEQLLALAQPAEAEEEQEAGTTLPWDPQVASRLTRLRSSVRRMQAIVDQVTTENLGQTVQDIERLEQAVPERRQQLLSLKEKYDQELERFQEYNNLDPCQETLLADIDPAVYDIDRLEAAPGQLEVEVARLEQQFSNYIEPLEEIEAYLDQLLEQPPEEVDFEELEQRVVFAVPSLLSDLTDEVLDLGLVQGRARADTVDLVPIDLDWKTARQLASQYRRDWMNAQASLVDSWRLIEFNADDLESNLDLVFQGDMQNVGDNPLRLRDINSQMRVGLRFDAPLTRLQERNTYRQALIEYEQARRNYYRFVDNITRTLRNTLRTIDLNRINFEERRIAVLSAIEQVVLNDQIQKLREERGLEAGVTAARDVVSALADLQSAQNDFLSVWLNYEAQRRSLDLDLGTMNLDPAGNWIDPGAIGPQHGYPAPSGHPAEIDLLHEEGHAPEPGLLPEPSSEPEREVIPAVPPDGEEQRGEGVIQSAFLDQALGRGSAAAAQPVGYEPQLRRLPPTAAPSGQRSGLRPKRLGRQQTQ